MNKVISHWVPLACIAALLSGCLNLREAEPPSLEELSPTDWRTAEMQALSSFDSVSVSAQLNDLVAEVLRNNYDLAAAYQRLEAVKAAQAAAFGARLPSLDASLTNQNQKSFGLETETANAALSLNWELDIWGRVASISQQATAVALEQEALYRSARYSLAAQFVQLWLDTIEARQQLALTTARIDSLRKSLDIIEDGFNSGIRPALDVYSARAELANNEAVEVQRQRTLNVLTRQLEVLLGRAPNLVLDLPPSLPVFHAALPAQLSSQLILRRPDLQAASFALDAAQSNVNTARANRLPRFSFTGSVGAASNALSNVLSGNESSWSLLGGVTAPLFRGGQLAAEQRRQQHLLAASIASYRQTALQAFQEVAEALDNEQLLNLQLAAAKEATEVSDLAQEQALEQYIAGISNVNTWLQSQRNAFDRRSTLLQVQALQLKNRVALYLALGGDFTAVENS